MLITVSSDYHIPRTGPADQRAIDFIRQTNGMDGSLVGVLKKATHIIAGDFLECLSYPATLRIMPTPGVGFCSASGEESSSRVVSLGGNHDREAFDSDTTIETTLRLHIEHGDRLGYWNREDNARFLGDTPGEWIARLACSGGKGLRDLVGAACIPTLGLTDSILCGAAMHGGISDDEPIYSLGGVKTTLSAVREGFQHFDSWMFNRFGLDCLFDMIGMDAGFSRSSLESVLDADPSLLVAVCGHTHRPHVTRYGGRIVADCGAFQGEHPTWLEIEGDANGYEVRLCRLNGNRREVEEKETTR